MLRIGSAIIDYSHYGGYFHERGSADVIVSLPLMNHKLPPTPANKVRSEHRRE
jgi:hypothetical protein